MAVHVSDGRSALVIGGGIIGLTTALMLLKRGLAVSVIDPGVQRDAASYGNAGGIAVGEVVPLANPSTLRKIPRMLMDSTSPLSIDPAYLPRLIPWLARFALSSRRAPSERIAGVLAQMLSRAIDDYDRMTSELDLEALRERNNSVRLYRDRQAYEADRALWDLRGRLGVRFATVEGEELAAKVPGLHPDYRLGVEVENYQTIRSPAGLADRVRIEFGHLGGHLRKARVTGIRIVSAREVEVRSDDGASERADMLVIAAGAWSNRLTEMVGESLPLETERGYHAQCSGTDMRLQRGIGVTDRSIVVAPIENGIRISGFVEFAGLHKPMDRSKAISLVAKARAVFPGLTFQDVDYWMGHRPSMPDCLPVIGRSSVHDRIFYNFGHGHLGVTLAPTSARLLGDIIDRRPPPFAAAIGPVR